MTSKLIFPLHLAGLKSYVLYELSYLRSNKYPFFDFSINYLEKCIFQGHKICAALKHCRDKIFFLNPSLMFNGGK